MQPPRLADTWWDYLPQERLIIKTLEEPRSMLMMIGG